MESREDLKAYLDGELNTAQADAVRAAAETNPETRKELEELRLVGSALSSMARDYEVKGLENTLRALDGDVRGGQATAPKKRWTWYGMGVGIAAAVTILYALPPMFGTSKIAAKKMLASNRFAIAHNPAAKLDSPVSASPTLLHASPLSVAANGANKVVPPTAIKPPLSMADQLKAEEAKLKQLQDENARLKATQSVASKNLVPPEGMALPAPMPPGEIIPNDALANSSANDQLRPEESKGLPPQRVAQLEAQVKKIAAGAGAKFESASGPAVLRVLSLTIDSTKAPRLADQIRGALKTAGTVTFEAVPPPGESPVVASTKAKIMDFRIQRERLLVDFLPEAPQVQELDRQIKILESSIKPDNAPPRTRLHVSIG